MAAKHASLLTPGDRFYGPESVPVVVLREAEPWTDLFGRDGLRLWCRREDTGAEGWMCFGPLGVVWT